MILSCTSLCQCACAVPVNYLRFGASNRNHPSRFLSLQSSSSLTFSLPLLRSGASCPLSLDMSIRPGSAYIRMYMVRRVSSQTHMPVVDLPAFLCPAWTRGQRQSSSRQRQLHSTSATTPLPASVLSKSLTPGKCFSPQAAIINLPQQCPGCGAFSQILAKNEPGFYSLKRRSVNDFLKGIPESEMSEEDALVKNSLYAAIGNDPGLLHKLHFTVAAHTSGTSFSSMRGQWLTLLQVLEKSLRHPSVSAAIISDIMIQAYPSTTLLCNPFRIQFMNLFTNTTMCTMSLMLQIFLCPLFLDCTNSCT